MTTIHRPYYKSFTMIYIMYVHLNNSQITHRWLGIYIKLQETQLHGSHTHAQNLARKLNFLNIQ